MTVFKTFFELSSGVGMALFVFLVVPTLLLWRKVK